MNASGGFHVRAILFIGVSSFLAGRVAGQPFSVLHTFTSVSGPIQANGDGANPSGSLILSGNTLYGTANYGGNSGWGTVFAINTDGTGFTTVYHFTGSGDGANPSAELVLSNNTLFGTASAGGKFGAGTLFAVNVNGSGFTNLHSFTQPVNDSFGFFTNADGAHPLANLIIFGSTLYGAANAGGSSGKGALFSVQTNSTGFTSIHGFSSGSGAAYSSSALVLSGNTLYGVNYGNLGNGTVFAVQTDGTSFTNHYAFSLGHPNGNGVLTNSDGANPHAQLILSGNTLFGTAENGGASGVGSVFAINTDGTGFTNLHSFATGAYNSSDLFTNSDGAHPSARLVLSGNSLYGTANAGGSAGAGTVFVVNTIGGGFANLYNFSATPPYPQPQTNSDGAQPAAGLVLSGFSLYGTTQYGGAAGNGTVFSLSFAPRLTIASFGSNVVLSWPSSAAGFDYSRFKLQSAPALSGPFTTISGAASPFTNSVAGARQYFRLSQ